MKIIGDPHLGRVFTANVPLDRRGERERMMLEQFNKELTTPEKLVIIIGDLFDTPKVPYQYVLKTIMLLQEHAFKHPDKKYIIIAGNHDISPSDATVGAFELLEVSTLAIENIHVLRKPTTMCGVVFFPWEWGRSALEQLDDITLWTDTAVGHWDLVDYGGDTGHLCPAKELQEQGVKNIISGHWHLAGDYTVDGVNVLCTGSMQPMTHAEDPEGKMYVTLTPEEYARAKAEDFRDKYIRIRGADVDGIEAPPTCLGFKTERVSKEQKVEEKVTLGDFDIEKILDKHLKEKSVPKEVASQIKENLSGLN